MDHDLLLVIGIVLLVLAIPSVAGALAERRAPRAGAVLVLVGGGLLVTALTGHPGGYAISEIPDVFVRVAARWL